jgi:hypothetical protein
MIVNQIAPTSLNQAQAQAQAQDMGKDHARMDNRTSPSGVPSPLSSYTDGETRAYLQGYFDCRVTDKRSNYRHGSYSRLVSDANKLNARQLQDRIGSLVAS